MDYVKPFKVEGSILFFPIL